MEYKTYLQSQHWREFAKHIRESRNYTCEGCGQRAYQVHHLNYCRVPYREREEDVELLCGECHKRRHGIIERADNGRASRHDCQLVIRFLQFDMDTIDAQRERRKAYNKKYYAANSEQVLAGHKRYRAANKESIAVNRAKAYRAYRIENRDKENARKRAWHAANKEKNNARSMALYVTRKAFTNAVKMYYLCCNPACDWHGEYKPSQLDFHHIDRKTKDFNISQACQRNKASLIDEINKCTVVCSNCHRLIEDDDLDASGFQRCNIDKEGRVIGPC